MICQCQDELAAHEHNRDGTDCALCPCPRYRRRRPWHRRTTPRRKALP